MNQQLKPLSPSELFDIVANAIWTRLDGTTSTSSSIENIYDNCRMYLNIYDGEMTIVYQGGYTPTMNIKIKLGVWENYSLSRKFKKLKRDIRDVQEVGERIRQQKHNQEMIPKLLNQLKHKQ
jgi:hypothetical protein